MKFSILLMSLIIVGFSHHKGITMSNESKKSIELHYSKDTVILGEEIQFFVTYHNRSSTPIAFRDPAKTWEVMFEVTQLSDSSIHRLPFGKIISKTSPHGIVAQSAEPAKEIVIKPKDKYFFVPDTYKRHCNIFEPGNYRVRVVDRTNDDETLYSNEIKIAVEATESSVEYLSIICADESLNIDKREFAVQWIKALYPTFTYELGNPDEDRKKTNAENISSIHTWRESHPSDPDLLKRIESINSKASLIQKK